MKVLNHSAKSMANERVGLTAWRIPCPWRGM